MPAVARLISPERVVCGQTVGNKQDALEYLATLLSHGVPNITTAAITASLLERERTCSTGVGRGIALPHGRVPGLQAAVGACLRLEHAIDFDALDGRPVDLLFALLVPQESPDAHLQWLAQLAQMFSDPEQTQLLRAARNDREFYTLLQHWEPRRATA